MVVDTGHSGRQTTLDACRHSKAPVIASHTAAEALYPHMRTKSDDELRAIAETGGVIGVFAMPWFIHADPAHTTMENVLNHIDYVAGVAGIDHVGIGTDWPMSDVTWSLVFLIASPPNWGFIPARVHPQRPCWDLSATAHLSTSPAGWCLAGTATRTF